MTVFIRRIYYGKKTHIGKGNCKDQAAAETTSSSKTEAVKEAAVEKTEAVKEAVAEKTEEVKAAVKEAAEKTVKTAKKTAAKKTAKKEIKVRTFVQYFGKEVEEKDMIAAVKKDWTKANGKKVGDIKDITLYVKPEEAAVYYVVNGTDSGKRITHTNVRKKAEKIPYGQRTVWYLFLCAGAPESTDNLKGNNVKKEKTDGNRKIY